MKVDSVAVRGGVGLLVRPSLAPVSTPRRSRRGVSSAGLVVNAVTPTALRMAPSLLVTDAEIDAAVAIVAQECAATGGRS